MANDMFKVNKIPRLTIEQRLSTLFGVNSIAIKALDIVCKEMCIEKGFTRDDGQDYYNHCISVANTLLSFCVKDEDTICAALLHDIIEDVEGYTYLTIKEMFNERVAYIALLVTKKKDINYKEEKNILNYLNNILQDWSASVIKTADRMHNMQTLNKKTFKDKYNKSIETEKYYLKFFEACELKHSRYFALFNTAKEHMRPFIFEIKSFYERIEELEKENKTLTDELNKSKKVTS